MKFLMGLLDIKSPTKPLMKYRSYRAGAAVRKVVKRLVKA